MGQIVQQPYNLFAQQKKAGYPGAVVPGANAPGVVVGETPEQNAAGRQAGTAGMTQEVVGKPQPTLWGTQPAVAGTHVQPFANAKGVVERPIDANSSTAGMDYLNSLYTDPQEEEKLRKSSVTNRRIMAVADALRHIGNIANTVKGAPSQQFVSPVVEEEARYERGRALRDRVNQQYYSYQQQKAAQDAKARQWEQQFGLQQANAASQHAYRQELARIAAERAANQKAYQEGTLTLRGKLGEAQQKERERHNKVAEQQGRQRIGIASQIAKNMQNYRQWKMSGGGGSGSSIAPLDTPKGQITPSGRNYNNQLQQIWNYAETKGLVKQSDVQRALAQAGIGNETPESVKRQQVMSLLRTNQSLADYAQQRLGWTYGASNPSTDWDEFAEEEENWDAFAED